MAGDERAELLELDDTVRATIEKLAALGQLDDTLVIVTADHGHGFDVTGSVALWDAAFVEAFACRLAVELVQSINKNMQLKQSLKQDYMEALKEAKRTNAIELPPQTIADDSWVLARQW